MRSSAVVFAVLVAGCRPSSGPPAFAVPPASSPSPRVVQLHRGDPDDGHHGGEDGEDGEDRSDPPPRSRPCREVEDFAGRLVCADPPGADGGFTEPAHPCPADRPLPGARPVRVRFIGLTRPGQGDCGFGGTVLRSLADAQALKARVPATCWGDSADALLRIDYSRFEAAVRTHTDHDGRAVRLVAGNVLHEVIGPGACKGTAPERFTSVVVRPHTRAAVRTHRCPRRPCLAP